MQICWQSEEYFSTINCGRCFRPVIWFKAPEPGQAVGWGWDRFRWTNHAGSCRCSDRKEKIETLLWCVSKHLSEPCNIKTKQVKIKPCWEFTWNFYAKEIEGNDSGLYRVVSKWLRVGFRGRWINIDASENTTKLQAIFKEVPVFWGLVGQI